jgi:hypothetical protein
VRFLDHTQTHHFSRTEPAIPAIKWLQTYALDHTTTEIKNIRYYDINKELADTYSFYVRIYLWFISCGFSVCRRHGGSVSDEMERMWKHS